MHHGVNDDAFIVQTLINAADEEVDCYIRAEGTQWTFGYGYSLLIHKMQVSDQAPTQETVSQSSAKVL